MASSEGASKKSNDQPSRSSGDKKEDAKHGVVIPDANVSIKNIVLVDPAKEIATEEQEVERKKLQ